MRFEIDFNRETNDELLGQLGAEKEDFEEYYTYFIELEDFEDLQILLIKLNEKTNDMYSAVISFDHPTIFLDNKV